MGMKNLFRKKIQIKKKARLLVPQKHIAPGGHEQYLRCGVCETYNFRIFVVPVENRAAISSIACITCGTVRKIELNNFIEGTGEITQTTEDNLKKSRMIIQ